MDWRGRINMTQIETTEVKAGVNDTLVDMINKTLITKALQLGREIRESKQYNPEFSDKLEKLEEEYLVINESVSLGTTALSVITFVAEMV